jgi:tRNA(fMet)-specific endonuclease VapC
LGQKKLKMRRPDMLIACIALAHDALLVTANTKHFNKVPGLKLANWTKD